MAKSAYIHIPFCKSKCKYCSFVSYPKCNEQIKHDYLDSLFKEIKHFYKNEPLKTLYLGGGTPSLLCLSDVEKIINCFSFENACEITMEVNPETVDYDYFVGLKRIGVNRISIGVQSFDDNILKNIGRIHTSEKAVETIISAQQAGFENLSCDFIYGLPEQGRDSFVNDLKKVVGMNVPHISLYGLKIEEGCFFFTNPPQNTADDDMQADMYLDAVNILKSEGYEHYEISNFCKKGLHSNHNLNYWNCEEYYGFGAAAHGYIDNARYANFADLSTYISNFNKKETFHSLSVKENQEEAVFLGFRRGVGICVSEINEKYGMNFEEKYKDVLEKYVTSGHIKKTDNRYQLSEEGFLVSNIILSEFLW